ncbi:PREDICTED: upstream stimulatory factor 2-like [Acromyrmex echinatior]|uniref:upstream stimulatory factor 2-like n=1 Tax=Acromyrmex echinatior TaxID=103372 RepID=UPI000580CC83|nr:PREDICTED: upstream stimulatory factor 2-like [Acromyrmex echinatior]
MIIKVLPRIKMETNHFDTIDESANENVIGAETVDVVLEEAEIVDCDADEQQDDDIQYHLYAINRRNNTVAYKVMQVSNDSREDNEISIATPVNNTVQVLTAPLNGQLYVLSNSNDIVTTESTKAVVPSVAKLHIEGSQNIITTVKKRDERRRVTHNEVERRRRDKISNWISKLAKLLADCEQYMDEEDTKPNLETLSKGGILARAYEYIMELKDAPDKLTLSLNENVLLMEEIDQLQQVVTELRNENSQLKNQVSKHDITILDNVTVANIYCEV